MLPSKYEINIAKADGVAWDKKPTYRWFCRVDAGADIRHAQVVAATMQKAFPAPEYSVTLHQCYEYARSVEEFDWRD